MNYTMGPMSYLRGITQPERDVKSGHYSQPYLDNLVREISPDEEPTVNPYTRGVLDAETQREKPNGQEKQS